MGPVGAQRQEYKVTRLQVLPPRCCFIFIFFEQMERCQQQVGLGLPPCPDSEEEWRRMLRDERRRRRDREERDRVSRRTNKQTKAG